MHHDDVLFLAKHRISQAHECLLSAENEVELGIYKGAANRSYYCIFHAMRAVLAFDKFDSQKHSGIISAFRQRYIKTGIFAAHFSDKIGSAFRIRNRSDYEDFYMVLKTDVVEQIDNAKMFLSAVEDYVNAVESPTGGQ